MATQTGKTTDELAEERTALGLFARVAGLIEYSQAIKSLRRIEYYSLWRPSPLLSLLMIAGGLFAFFGVLFDLR